MVILLLCAGCMKQPIHKHGETYVRLAVKGADGIYHAKGDWQPYNSDSIRIFKIYP